VPGASFSNSSAVIVPLFVSNVAVFGMAGN
jgi:hypothetical protein